MDNTNGVLDVSESSVLSLVTDRFTSRVLWIRSLVNGGFHKKITSADHLPKLLKQIGAIVRAGGGFGVILHAEQRPAAVAHAFQGAVVEVEVGRFQVARKRVQADREAVVLRRDF